MFRNETLAHVVNKPDEHEVAARLVWLYEEAFGGKPRGRYRISMKHMKVLTGRRRVPAETLGKIAEELFEMGFVLIDLETFFVVLAQSTFRSYRRTSDGCVSTLSDLSS